MSKTENQSIVPEKPAAHNEDAPGPVLRILHGLGTMRNTPEINTIMESGGNDRAEKIVETILIAMFRKMAEK